MKRRHLEFEIVFFSYILIGLISGILAIPILKGMNRLVPQFFAGDILLSAFVPLLIAAFMATYIILTKFDYHFRKLSFAASLKRSLNETLLLAACWAMILVAAKSGVTDSRHYFFCTLIINFLLMTAEWVFISGYLVPRYRNTDGASLVGIITNSKRVHYVTKWMEKDWARRVTGICLVDKNLDEAPAKIDGIPVTSDLTNLIETVQLHPIDEVFFEIDEDERKAIMHPLHEMIRMGVRVHLNVPEAQRLDEAMANVVKDDYTPEIMREFKYGLKEPVIIMGPPRKRMRSYIAKRTLDIIGGIVGLAICGVLYIILGIAIKIDSPGPVIFAQERIGMNGRRFKMYKFRSMYQDAEERKKELLSQNEMNGLMFKMENDPRITKVGKFIRKTSLDEFPQFWNVLKGDMSLVGTRPPTVGEFRQYSSYHKRRLSMRPGITGLWQTSGRSDILDFEEVVRLDCKYIDTWTVGGDIKILLNTVGQIFKHEGAK